jgi:TPR repeat protein
LAGWADLYISIAFLILGGSDREAVDGRSSQLPEHAVTTPSDVLRRRAARGHAQALSVLAWRRANGVGENADAVGAVVLWRKAASAGNHRAMLRLWWMHDNGFIVEESDSEARRFLSAAAEGGDPLAMALQGRVVYRGARTEEERAEGVEWIVRSAKAGSVMGRIYLVFVEAEEGARRAKWADVVEYAASRESQLETEEMEVIGRTYLTGRAGLVNVRVGLSWLVKAARCGGGHSAHEVGVWMLHKSIPVVDGRSAEDWLRLGAGRGDPLSMADLGRVLRGDESEERRREGVGWLARAARLGHKDAMAALGRCLRDGSDIARDPAGAAAWLERAAKRDHLGALVDLALMLRGGEGIPRNRGKSVELLRRGAQLGDGRAKGELATAYYWGWGVDRDISSALRFWREGAQQGDAQSMYEYGCLLLSGDEIPRDEGEARRWFTALAERGDPRGQYWVGAIHYYGRGVPKDPAAARPWLEKAAAGRHRSAMVLLSLMYRTGRGVSQSTREAERWERLAKTEGIDYEAHFTKEEVR